MTRKVLGALLLLAIAGAVFAQSGGSQEFIVISKAPKRARVAIPVFKTEFQSQEGFGLGEELANLLGKDLTRTGFFELVPRPSYLKAGPAFGEQEDWAAWNLLNTQYVVRGEMEETGQDQYQLTLKLMDGAVQKMSVGKSYKGSKSSLRRMIHRFADECVDYLTGKRGGFESRIAFVSDKGGRKEIYVADSDGFNPVPVTNTHKLNLSPAWIDPSTLIYIGYDDLRPVLYSLDITSKARKVISSAQGLNISPAAGPAGKKLAVAMESPGENLDIYIVNPDGSNPLRVTNHPAADLEPTWSPDGRYLAFVSDRSGAPQIYMIDLYQGNESTNNKPIRLTNSGSYNTSPAWSPDGRYLAYVRRTGSQFDLYMIDFQGAGGRTDIQLTNTPYNEEDPSWSPDGRMLVYSGNKNGNYDLFVISIYSKEPVQITDWPTNETQPSWSQSLYEKGG